jgi:hypothetical protein
VRGAGHAGVAETETKQLADVTHGRPALSRSLQRALSLAFADGQVSTSQRVSRMLWIGKAAPGQGSRNGSTPGYSESRVLSSTEIPSAVKYLGITLSAQQIGD